MGFKANEFIIGLVEFIAILLLGARQTQKSNTKSKIKCLKKHI